MSSTATKFEEITVMRQSSQASRPSIKMAVAAQFAMGPTTQRQSRKMMPNTKTMMPIMAAPNVTRSERTKLIISAAIIGTPPTKICARSR